VTDAAPRPGVRGVLAVLREPYWLRAAFVVIALSVACVLLGRWQWGRHEGKLAMAQQIDRAYGAAPASLAQLLPAPSEPLPKDEEWRPVGARGTYLADETVVIRNRPNGNGEFGYEVVVPFRVDGGPVLLVDRGWIPNGASGARPDTVPAPPTGEVGVVARLRPTERPVTRVAPAGQAERIDVPRLTAAVDGPAVTQAYGILAQEQPAPAGAAPALIPRPDGDLGPHQAYAIQWWLGAVAVYVLLVVYARKEAQGRLLPEEGSRPSPAREPAAGPDPEGGPAGGLVRAAPGTGGRGGGRVPALRVGRRSGPRELTDEEWEDLADARLEAGVGDRVVGGGARVDDHDAGARTPGHVDE
jgi:cytochrome oxidase assembly protein ShyY1